MEEKNGDVLLSVIKVSAGLLFTTLSMIYEQNMADNVLAELLHSSKRNFNRLLWMRLGKV